LTLTSCKDMTWYSFRFFYLIFSKFAYFLFYFFLNQKGKVYELTGHPVKCNSTAVTGKMTPTWGWIQQASFKGQKVIDHVTIDLWSYSIGGVTLTIAVRPHAPNVPVGFERASSTETVFVF